MTRVFFCHARGKGDSSVTNSAVNACSVSSVDSRVPKSCPARRNEKIEDGNGEIDNCNKHPGENKDCGRGSCKNEETGEVRLKRRTFDDSSSEDDPQPPPSSYTEDSETFSHLEELRPAINKLKMEAFNMNSPGGVNKFIFLERGELFLTR